MTALSLSPRPALFEDDFKLSDTRCVRWFLEGLEALKRFDETVSTEALREAERLLSLCVENYPKDLLPKFYLGVAKSILDDMSQEEAIQCFTTFLTSKNFEVRAAAKYNLASAYLETYDQEAMEEAERVLSSLLEDLRDHGASLGQHELVRKFIALFRGAKPRIEVLHFLAEEVRSYLQIDLRLWRPRWKAEIESHDKLARDFLRELKGREHELGKHARFLGKQAQEIWAWHWNNVGLIEESRAVLELRSSRSTGSDGGWSHLSKRSQEAGQRARNAYDKALVCDPRWDSARSNLGRLLWEIFDDVEGAIAVYQTALNGVEDVDYNHYYLGILHTWLGLREEALKHFEQSPEMLKIRQRSADWTGARKMLAYELKKIGRVEDVIKVLRELVAEDTDDVEAKIELSSLIPTQENN